MIIIIFLILFLLGFTCEWQGKAEKWSFSLCWTHKDLAGQEMAHTIRNKEGSKTNKKIQKVSKEADLLRLLGQSGVRIPKMWAQWQAPLIHCRIFPDARKTVTSKDRSIVPSLAHSRTMDDRKAEDDKRHGENKNMWRNRTPPQKGESNTGEKRETEENRSIPLGRLGFHFTTLFWAVNLWDNLSSDFTEKYWRIILWNVLRSFHNVCCDPVVACGGVAVFIQIISKMCAIFSQLTFHNFIVLH